MPITSTATGTVEGSTVVTSARRRLSLVLILGALTALGPPTIDLYLPALPQVSEELPASPAITGPSRTAFMLGTARGQLVIGPPSDTLGRPRPLLVGLT